MAFISEMIQNDLRNNSAWNQRYWVLQQTNGLKNAFTLQKQIEFTFGFIELAPKNESPINFLRGLVPFLSTELLHDTLLKCEEFVNLEGGYSPHLVAFVADVNVQNIRTKSSLARAVELYEKLKSLDPVRVGYWTLLSDEASALSNTIQN
eukprot:c9313_g1_i2.p1 GENE.c9313_g1_i2~~c9313_g1_i2.p1  ORF type:complete len:150 (+),score=43.62 c9313_g1_i2:153-602(+)